MYKFFVLWTYIGNYSKLIEVRADTPLEAINTVTWLYGKDFQEKASIYVFDKKPAFVKE